MIISIYEGKLQVMKLDLFFAKHKIFTKQEIVSSLSKENPTSALPNSLVYHQKRGHILHIRRGLYYTIPKGIEPNECSVDSFLVASKMAEDAVLGYRTSLDFFGKLHSTSDEFIYLSRKKETKPFVFKNCKYHAVSIPKSLQKANQINFGVITENRLGQKIKITNLERTFVDVLDRPYLCGSWEEIWLSLESIEYLNLDHVFHYVQLLKNTATTARVGFFLESHRDQWMVPESYLSELQKHIPKQPHYLNRDQRKEQKLISKWNLIVPLELIKRGWEEPHENI